MSATHAQIVASAKRFAAVNDLSHSAHSAHANGWAAWGDEAAETSGMKGSAQPNALADVLAPRCFDISNPPPAPVAVYALAAGIIATPGNVVGLQAQAKAGKSAFVGAMLAAAMGGNGDCLGVVSANPHGLAVIHFDTEQSPADHHNGIMRALHRAGLTAPPPWLRSYRLADVPLLTRRAVLAFELERAAADAGGIHSVILDGVADLCADPNDPAEAFALVDALHQLAIRFAAPIVAVLHENPGSETGKTRGHLGSQLERKAGTNLRLAKDPKGVTVVFAERARHAHIPRDRGQRFKWCDDAKMHVATITTAETKDSAKRERLRELAVELFRDTPEAVGLTWAQLHERIEEKEGVGRSGARKKFDALIAAKVIRKSGEKYWRA